jgi:hypothetical protein
MAYTDIDKPSDYFNTKLYTGTEVSGNSITGVGFQPDFIWIKNRTDATNHNLYDSVRGGNGTSHYFLKSNVTNAEGTNTSSLLTIDSDGFTLGDGNEVNGASDNMVSWNWLASNTTASNTDGSITSTVSANTTSGFSIVSYTGTGSAATVGHGLGVKPNMIITKRRNGISNWMVYNSTLGATKYLQLETTDAVGTSSTRWNDTEPTSSFFTVGTSSGTNPSSGTMIAYCFAEKQGYSKFGSYTGNSSADGTFVYTGFKPAFVIIKPSNYATSWNMFDNKRSAFNEVDKNLFAEDASAEVTDKDMDFLSNGFKLRTTSTGVNGSYNYIYMAFAESPFTTSTGIPTTAR